MGKRYLDSTTSYSSYIKNHKVGKKVLNTIGRKEVPTISEYLNQSSPKKLPKEIRTNIVNGEKPLSPNNLEFYLATAASAPTKRLIKSTYNAPVPYVQKGLQTLGEMLTPSTYLKGVDPVIKGLADVIPIAGLGANSIESIRRVGFNPENVAGLTLALSPLASGAKGLRETANAFKDAINDTRWMQTRNLAKSLFPDVGAFKRNPDGTVSIIRDWNDPRVSFKLGGKMFLRFNKK